MSTAAADTTIKGLAPSTEKFDGSDLRILIVHARWNEQIITPLVQGCISALKANGVKEKNIHVESVPGSYELPLAVQRLYAASAAQALNAPRVAGGADDLLSLDPISSKSTQRSTSSDAPLIKAFDAIIPIGVLIKGQTQHFEYISESVISGLTQFQISQNVLVIYGVLNLLTEEQGLVRAGVGKGVNKGHNHGEDWGNAAVEMAVKGKKWAEGII